MDTKTMETKLMECRTAYMNSSMIVKGQVAHFMEPMLQLLAGLILAVEQKNAGGMHGNHA